MRGLVTALDAFKIHNQYEPGPQGGILLGDKNGYPAPVGAFKMLDDQVGVMVLDGMGKWVPVTLFNESSESFIRCGQGTVASGGSGHFLNNHRIGPEAGIVCIYYDTYSQSDQISVYYNGELIVYTYDGDPFTPAPVSRQGCLYFQYEPVGTNYNIQVHVDAEETGTNWWYNVVCPTGSCKNKQPKLGNATYHIPYGGNCCNDGDSSQNQTNGVNANCHYSSVVCGCRSRKRVGKLYREVVKVVSIDLPHATANNRPQLQAYTIMEFRPTEIYCTSHEDGSFMDCSDGNPSLIHRPLGPVAVNDILWDYCSEGPGCAMPYHNIFFRLCQNPFNYLSISGNPIAHVTLSCTITEVETCPEE